MPTNQKMHAYNQAVIAEFRARGGTVADPAFPILLLTTTGARTGQPTTTPLAYGIDGDRVFVVASKTGAPGNPAWFHNLQANPSVTVELGSSTYAAQAVVTDPAERDRLYAAISAQIRQFQEYEQLTDRVFPVIVLEGVPAPKPGSPKVLLDGLGFPESTRWREGRAWLCNWGTGEVLAVFEDGEYETMAAVAPQTLPFSIDWLPDGRMLIIDGPQRLLLVQAPDGSLSTHADLTGFGAAPFNELVVDAAGNAYVNGGSGVVVRVDPDGRVRQVADGLRWPNGMVLVDGDRTLVVADSHAEQLVGFDVAADGTLSGRRVWAPLKHAPDGICADAEGAVWVASVPGQRCVRVHEGGDVLDTVAVDRGCFACMLGGADGRTLFIAAAEWRGMEAAISKGPGQTGRLLAAPGQRAPHAGHP